MYLIVYQSYFGLAEAPFSIAPDPRYLYMSQHHQEALAHLLYGVNGDGGFVLLTGEVGTGKTTICRCLLEQIPESCDVAYIFNPKLTVEELLSTICVEFGIACPAGNTSIKVFVDCINVFLLDAHAKGRHTVLIIDEAQNLSADVLEQMRLLTNLETNQRKLLQIILLGQPELAAMLERPELRQLAQRIVARYHLGPLTKPEVAAYVKHRFEVAGAQRQLFPAALMGRLYRLSGGIPRVINVLCDRALLGTYVQGKERIDRATLAQAAREVFHQPPTRRRGMYRALAAGLILLAGGALVMAVYQQGQKDAKTTMVQQIVAKRAAPAAPAKAADQTEDAKPEAALPDTLEWPADAPRARSEAMAYAALFRAWGADYRGADACQQAEGLGLRCRTSRGGLAELRQLNRPAVLQLRDELGREFYATLTALEDKTAAFAIGAETKPVAISALATQWSGRYTLLWRMPPGARENIRPGERGPAVEWLSKQLAQLQGRVADAIKDPAFDDALARHVKQFQLAQGLVPDGAVGPLTLIHLSGVADQTAPKLFRGRGGKIRMSYILDALRRSDQQRLRGAVPTLLTAQAATVAPKQPAFLFYGLIAAVLVGAGIAIGWLRPWQPEHTAPVTGPIATKPPESDPRQTAPAPLPASPEIARKPERQLPVQKSTSAAQPAPARAAMKRDTPARAETDTHRKLPKAVTAVPKAAATLMPEQSVGTGPTDAAQDQRVMTMAELPLAIQQEIPGMTVSVHAYSGQPQNRLVGINERMLREGGYVAPGLRLEQITPDGMIFSYKGYRFSRGVRSSGPKVETR